MFRIRLQLLLTAALLVASAGLAAAQSVNPSADALSLAIHRSQILGKGAEIAPKACELMTIACGQTVAGNLTNDDCPLDDGSLIDFYTFSGQNGQTVTINMTSNAFDTFLFLLDPTPTVVATDDDGGQGTNSRIVFPLDQTSSDWAIGANSFDAGQTGPYTLSLQCSGNNPPPPPPPPPPPSCPMGFFPDASYPDFCFRVTIGNPGDTRDGVREDDCQPDTVCVSGALAGRSEVFLRILGPRPNGYLWPTLVRFTPSRVVVDFYQLSTMQTNTYTLPAIPPGVDDLSGLQDRTGFLP